MKKLISAALVMVLVLGLAGCGAEKNAAAGSPVVPVEPGVLRVAALYDITTMDVTKTTDNYMVPMNIFDRLFEVQVNHDGSSEIVPSLCLDYQISEDGLTYSFTLRDDVVFSNGSALTASDVQYTFERLLTSGGMNSDIAQEVAGAGDLQDGASDTLSGFQVQSDTEFSITLSAPNAGFLAELTGPAMSVVDAETMAQAADFGISCDDTIGTGPYKITEWVVNDHYTLEYNDLYWGEEPSVKKMIVSIIPDASTQNLMYQNGELDLLDLEYLDASIVESTYKTTYQDRLVSASRVGITYLAMNANQQYLSDVAVRRAVQMAADVDAIIASVYAGDAIVENGIIPTGIWGHNEALIRPAFDPEAARALLQNAGYEDGDISFELAMDASASGNIQLVYQIIQQNLKDIGIEANITTYDESSWLDLRKSGNMDSFIATWTMDYNDPANIMDTFFGNPDNTALRSLNYADTSIMERVEAASGIADDQARLEEYQALEEKIAIEDASWVSLFGNTHLFALGERVSQFTPYWAGYSNFYAKDVVLK